MKKSIFINQPGQTLTYGDFHLLCKIFGLDTTNQKEDEIGFDFLEKNGYIVSYQHQVEDSWKLTEKIRELDKPETLTLLNI